MSSHHTDARVRPNHRTLTRFIEVALVLGVTTTFGTAMLFSQSPPPNAGLQAMHASADGKGGGDETGAYDVVPNWPQNYCGKGFVIGASAGVFAETPDRVYIFSRGCLPAIEDTRGQAESFIPLRNAANYDLSQADSARHPRWDHIVNIVDRNGKLVDSWEQHNKLFVRPHRVLMNPYDPEKHIWLVDDGAHSIYKFTNDGKKLVMTLGEFKVPGNDERHFARPTEVAWLPDGTFFVSDGYVNTRVVKFDRNGKFLMTWGQKGNEPNETRPGYMNTVHAIAIDKNRRIYVSDRANSRVQVFDENGKFLDAWPGIRRPYSFLMAADQHLWISDGNTQKFLKFNLAGKLLHSWGTFGQFPGGFWGVHQFSVDTEGNLYTADVHVGRAQKFRPKKGADPARLIGRPEDQPSIRWAGRPTSAKRAGNPKSALEVSSASSAAALFCPHARSSLLST